MLKVLVITCPLFSCNVLAFIASSKRIERTHVTATFANTKPRKGFGGGGFATKQSEPHPKAVNRSNGLSKDLIFNTHFSEFCYKEDVSNLLTMFEEMQQHPQKLPTEWIDNCKVEEHAGAEAVSVIASKDVDRGKILTLLPIHAVGLRNVRESRDGVEYIEFNTEEAEIQYAKGSTVAKFNIPLNPNEVVYPITGEKSFIRLFVLSYPDNKRGWLGGCIVTESGDANCVTLPIPSAAPFCAAVATKDIKKGDRLIMRTEPLKMEEFQELNAILEKEEHNHISLLRRELHNTVLGPVHKINLSYPGVKQIHKDPDVYQIEDFLTESECERIISDMKSKLKPVEIFDEESGKYKRSYRRTHTSAKFSHTDPVIQKLADLAMINPTSVDGASVLNYQTHQEVKPHTDHASIKKLKQFRVGVGFCYLNDVSSGGNTYFSEIDLDIQPRRGTLVVHFPADLKGRLDERTLHQGSPAIDEKWLLVVTWSNVNNASQYKV